MFKFWSSQEQQASPRPQESSTNSWYPPSVSSSTNSNTYTQRLEDQSHLSSHHVSQSPIVYLKDKSVDELRRLLSNQVAYQQFLVSIDPVRIQNNVRDELKKETMQLARENLEKEPQITELRNQCMIIRTMELASAEEKLHDLKQRAECLKSYSPSSLLHKLQESMDKTEEESEKLHEQLLKKEIDVATFTKKYKQLRIIYHKKSLTFLAANTTLVD